MVRKILQIGDQILTKRSQPVPATKILSREIQGLIDDMIETCGVEAESTAGLSAVQIGVPQRIYVVRRVDLKRDSDSEPIWEAMINPEVKVLDPDILVAWEGCMSVGEGDERLFGPVERPRKVQIQYLDRLGKPHTLEAKDYFSHIIQHEQDHLDGILFLRYIKNPQNLWKSRDLDKYIARFDTYPPIAD